MKSNSNVSENAASSSKRKRTFSQYSYWLNGLRWSQHPHDERARSFRKERVVFPSEDAEISEVSPVCCLCEKCYNEEDIYIACEKCEGKHVLLVWHIFDLRSTRCFQLATVWAKTIFLLVFYFGGHANLCVLSSLELLACTPLTCFLAMTQVLWKVHNFLSPQSSLKLSLITTTTSIARSLPILTNFTF